MRPRLRYFFDRQQGLCAYCRRLMTKPSLLPPVHGPLTVTLDHRTPVSRGGTNRAQNLLAACATCNTTKGNMTWEQWVAYMRANPDWYVAEEPAAHPEPPLYPRPKKQPARSFTAGETSQWLRDQGALSLLDWPWLIQLTRDRVRQVGWGPW